MVCAPTVAGLYVTAQLLSPAVPVAGRPQLGALKGPLPGGRLVTPKGTVPLGMADVGTPVTVWWTMAASALETPGGTRAGLLTVMVVVGWIVASSIFFFNDPATTEISTLSLHVALPISVAGLYVTAQLLSPAVPVAVRPQLGALKVPLPGGRLVTPKVTVPLGLVASAGTVTVSWTVAVQVRVPADRTEARLRSRIVGRGLLGADSTKVSFEPECGASPP